MQNFDDIELNNSIDDVETNFVSPNEPRRVRKEPSNLDRLRSIMAVEVSTEPCNIPVPLRKGLSIDVEVEGLTVDSMERYTKQCTSTVGNSNRRARRNGQVEEKTDQLMLASLVLHNHCVSIRIGGEVVTDSQGNALTVTDPEFLSMLNIASNEDVVSIMKEIFVMDIHIMDAFMALQEYLDGTMETEDGESPLVGS